MLVLVLLGLSACAPVLLAGGAAATAISYHDRRLTGVQTDDELSEWKGRNRLPEPYRDAAHVNFTVFNRIMLLTGEVPNEAARLAIGRSSEKIEGIRKVHNELKISPVSALNSRAADTFMAAKFRVRLVDSNRVSLNHLKSVTEQGTLYLMGLVSEKEAQASIELARTTEGVRKVVNLLEIIPAGQ
jgi:osmotically-inducible protein OsmY